MNEITDITKARIRERLGVVKKTQAEISLKAASSDSWLKNILAGKSKSPGVYAMVILADELDCDVDYLLDRQSMPRMKRDAPHTRLRVVGAVEAGAYRETVLYPEATEEVDVPHDYEAFPHLKRYLLDVRGDSFDVEAPPGSYAVCVNFAETGLELRAGLKVVAERTRFGGQLREATLKEVALVDGNWELHPKSHNPAHKPIKMDGNAETDTVEITSLVLGFYNRSYP